MKGETLFTIVEIIRETGGEVAALGRAGLVSTVAVDSRACTPDSLFVALPGERTDGHLFVDEAVRNGSSLTLVNRTYALAHKEKISQLARESQAGFVIVENTLGALQALARFHLRRLPEVLRVGITGSSGKTTTKELVGSILKASAAPASPAAEAPRDPGASAASRSGVFVTEGNLNSEIGLPLSAMQVRKGDRYAVFEMGMNHRGEMDGLADIVRPDIAAITNIGTAHIGPLGSQDAIAEEKKRIFSRFDGRQTGFVFEGEPYFSFLSRGVRGSVLPYGPTTTPGFEGAISLGFDGFDLRVRGRSMRLSLVGIHNLHNALCAISVAEQLGVPLADVQRGLEAVRPVSGRGEVLRGRITVLQDSYNANPESFATAVDFLDDVPWEGRKVIVAGSMKELGQESEMAHARVGSLLAESAAAALFLFGEEMEAAYRQCAGRKETVVWITDFDALRRTVVDFVRDGDFVLLKGSRSMELERLLPHLTNERRPLPEGG